MSDDLPIMTDATDPRMQWVAWACTCGFGGSFRRKNIPANCPKCGQDTQRSTASVLSDVRKQEREQDIKREESRAGRNGDSQPMPKPGKGDAIQVLVANDIIKRMEVGRQRYGTYLQAHNGRNALLDAYEEALDLCVYLKQCLVEQEQQ